MRTERSPGEELAEFRRKFARDEAVKLAPYVLVAVASAWVAVRAFFYHWAHPELSEMQVLQRIAEWIW